MEKSTLPQKRPYKANVKQGEIYFWCSCGLSNKQPYCDGSHKKEGKFKSVKFVSTKSKDVLFCGCKKTNNPPFCDGSHSR